MTENAFAALGNDHRVDILRTLVVAVESEEPGLAFTDLYDRLEIDSTSQFSYHLDRLTEEFVREVDGKYRPTSAGERVVRAIRSGMYTEAPSFESVTVDGPCPACESTTLRAAYDDPHLQVACTDCGATVVTYDLLPAEVEGRDAMETLRACNRRVLRGYETAIAGSCPTCNGATDVTIETGPEDDDYACVAECSQCALRLFAPVELPLFGHPAVIAFYWEHGVDVTELPLWQLAAYIGDADRRVCESDPLALELQLHRDGASITARIDADGSVSVLD